MQINVFEFPTIFLDLHNKTKLVPTSFSCYFLLDTIHAVTFFTEQSGKLFLRSGKMDSYPLLSIGISSFL